MNDEDSELQRCMLSSNHITKSILQEFSRKKIRNCDGIAALTTILSGYMALLPEIALEEFIINFIELTNENRKQINNFRNKD